jgi:hypothetical protein
MAHQALVCYDPVWTRFEFLKTTLFGSHPVYKARFLKTTKTRGIQIGPPKAFL